MVLFAELDVFLLDGPASAMCQCCSNADLFFLTFVSCLRGPSLSWRGAYTCCGRTFFFFKKALPLSPDGSFFFLFFPPPNGGILFPSLPGAAVPMDSLPTTFLLLRQGPFLLFARNDVALWELLARTE